jgi:hypothetical protein
LCLGYFLDRVLQFFPGWPQTNILLPMAYHVAGITGTCHYTQLID